MKLNKNNQIIVASIATIVLIFVIFLIWANFPAEEAPVNLNKGVDSKELVRQQIAAEIAKYDHSLNSEQQIVDQIKVLAKDNLDILEECTESTVKETRYLCYIAVSGLTNTLPEKRTELIAILKNGLTDSDATIKVQVAQLILVWGEKDAVTILIDALDKNEAMVPSEPPTTLNFYSHMVLAGHTSVDFGYDKAKWQSWWSINQNKVNWDSKTEKFK